MKTAVIIQARLGSKRFPRKVLADLCGKSVLQHVIDRSSEIGPPVILAVPDRNLCMYGTRCFIGPEDDVLKRYLMAANAYSVELIVRITADCPLLRPDLCREVLELYHESGCSYAAIGWPMTFPKGYGCEVFSRQTLALADGMANDQYDREHVTPWMERNLKCAYLTQENDEAHISYCIDTKEDLDRVQAIMIERTNSENKYGGPSDKSNSSG